jgi:iron complex transport system permease protein
LSDGLKFALLSALLLASVALSLFFGGSEDVRNGSDASAFIFREIRIPKTLTAIAAGSTLAVSGLILQVLFRNPLAGPYVLGISSGASLMVALVLMGTQTLAFAHTGLGGRTLTVTASVTGSLLVTFLILAVSRRISSNVVLLLVGLMFSYACGAIEASLAYFADPGSLKTFIVWGMGSLSGTGRGDMMLFLPLSVVATGAALFFIKPLNALLLGEDYARSAGIDFRRSRFMLILLSSALTGITTAYCGPIAFAGIAVPVLSRMIFNTSRQQVHYFSCLILGSTLLLLADAAGHSLIDGVTLPVNILTTFIGAPLVISLMFRNKTW